MGATLAYDTQGSNPSPTYNPTLAPTYATQGSNQRLATTTRQVNIPAGAIAAASGRLNTDLSSTTTAPCTGNVNGTRSRLCGRARVQHEIPSEAIPGAAREQNTSTPGTTAT